MGNQLPPWAAQNHRPANPPRRALDPETGLPFRTLTAPKKGILTMIKKLTDLFHEKFLFRRITSLVTGVVIAINAAHVAPEITPEQAVTVATVLSAGCALVFECIQKWLRLKFMKPEGGAK